MSNPGGVKCGKPENHYCCRCHRTTQWAPKYEGAVIECLACGALALAATLRIRSPVSIGSPWSNRKRGTNE